MSNLFNQDLLQHRIKRALPHWAQHDFLYIHTADQLRDRMLDIKRDVPSVAVIGWPTPVIDHALRGDKKITNTQTLSPLETVDGILPLTPDTQDAVISHLALHLADDPGLMLRQYYFALHPDGVMVGCLLGNDSLFELRTVLADVEQELYGGISPRIHPMMSVQDVAGLMQQTGFALPVVDVERVTVTYGTLDKLLNDLRGTGQANILRQRRTHPVGRKFWQRVEELYRERFADERGRLILTLDVIYMLGWAPHPSQPQPKKRGSATVQLGDALAKRS